MNIFRDNKNIIAAAVLAGGLVATPHAVSAAIAGTTTVTGTGSAGCPSGYRVVGGGFRLPNDSFGSASSSEYKITSSLPSYNTRWQATAVVVRGSYSSTYGWRYSSSSYSPSVHATCVK